MFIVVYDDGQGLCVPFGWDEDCDGALCAIGSKDNVASFETRAEARSAINVSAKYAALCKAQDKPVNDDFIGEARRNIRIVRCVGRSK